MAKKPVSRKSLWEKVKTQANYFHRKKLNLSHYRLCKAVGEDPNANSTIDRYVSYLKSEGFMEALEPGVFKIVKSVPKDLRIER